MRRGFSLLLAWLILGPSGLRAGGTVEGVVKLDAMKPQPVSPGYKPQTVKPIQKAEPPVAIVSLEGPAASGVPRKTGNVRIRQNGYQFRPSILVVQTGTTIDFPNEDDEFHNVFSYSKTRRFDLGRYRKDETAKQVTFDKAGVGKIYCEIHQHMRCVVVVVDTPLFTTTDAQGRFRIKDVPPGEYSMKVFLPSEKTVTSEITVREGQTLQLKL
jgi:plastocyanin